VLPNGNCLVSLDILSCQIREGERSMETLFVSLLCSYIIYQNQRIGDSMTKFDERLDRVEVRLAVVESHLPRRKDDDVLR
jgi:hypothetical protein